MGQSMVLTGIVLSAMPVGDYDKRLVILTREKGKITAFARGARKQNSALLAAANPFAFGEFTVYPGRSAFTLTFSKISNYFVELSKDYASACYGFYFLEIADYYGREGNEELEMLKLLYLSLKALMNEKLENELIRYIFELRSLMINGEYPQMFLCTACGCEVQEGFFSVERGGLICTECVGSVKDQRPISAALLYTMQYVITAKVEKLYTFTLKPQIQKEFGEIMNSWRAVYQDRRFKSLEILRMLK